MGLDAIVPEWVWGGPPLLRALWPALMVLFLPCSLLAQTPVLPLEIRQDQTRYNLQSTNGVPLSDVVGNPPGSDGRASVTPLVPTPNQFSSLVSYGAVAPNPPPSGAAASIPGGVLVLKRAQVGAPFLNRPISFLLGSVIGAPLEDYLGALQPDNTHWLAEPFSTNQHVNAAYYWSPHAEEVFAIQPGPISVTWVQAAPYAVGTEPVYQNELGVGLGIPSFVTNGANVFLLKTESYIVSGSAIKAPRRMYWTQKGFQKAGKPVTVPAARVGAVNIVYNNTTFTRTVPEEYVGIGATQPGEGGTNAPLPELRTLWYDQQLEQIYAYNLEGRVFVEFLGDLKPDNVTREHIGFEIVEVGKQAVPFDLVSDLGERLIPPTPGTVDDLFAEPVLQEAGDAFGYENSVAGSEFLELYAARETVNPNDYLVYWMQESEVAGIKWPKYFARYQMIWPDDVAKYSHYVRPRAATEAEAEETAVQLAAETIPAIEYQDALDRPRGKITADSRFYTWLDLAQPLHRTLLRFTAGESVAFERVYSWLDETLITTNLAGTAATNLTSVADYLAYPAVLASYQAAYADYLVDLADYQAAFATYTAELPRGVNGTWRLRIGNQGTEGGTIDSWAVMVETTTPGTGTVNTNEFAGSAYTIPPNNTQPFQGITVSGITNAVTSVQIELNGFSHPSPASLFPIVYGPTNALTFLWSLAGGNNPVSALDLVFDDAAATLIPANLVSGTYKPSSGSPLAGQLLPAPTAPIAPIEPVAPADASTPWPDAFTMPRVVTQAVEVGQRISAPSGEVGDAGGEDYLAGHLNLSAGTLYNVNAYVDPFTIGFPAANLGAIIPVNAIPGANELEAWWFRENNVNAGVNAGDASKGFSTIYWPSVIGRYTIEWPTAPREIVMASKLGGENLSPLEAQGTIYVQNDPALDGYNPNEEHALMSGGTPFATRDDLNITTNGPGYSSEPFVLVGYTEADERPAVTPFKVLREKPEAGYVFDYITPAGQLLQPPPPLTFLPKPVEGSGDNAVNYNTEPTSLSGDLPVGWVEGTHAGTYGHYKGFTYRDRNEDFWVYRGLHAGRPALEAGTYVSGTGTFIPLTNAVAAANTPFRFSLHTSRQDPYLTLTVTGQPGWLSIDNLSLTGTPGTNDVGVGSTLTVVVEDRFDVGAVITNVLSLSVQPEFSAVQTQSNLVIASTNPYTGNTVDFSTRPPYLAQSPNVTNSFTLQYYYKTADGFAWPGVATPPAVGSIVPYLRAVDTNTMQFVGSPDSKTEALEIVYRPVWPVVDPADSSKPLPTLQFGATQTEADNDLPGVRDWKTAHVLYQQSIAADMTKINYSAVLHDPTVIKLSNITNHMERVPGGVKTELLRGRVYFPNLPPHLGQRLYLDPNRGAQGSLVLAGEFKDEILGDKYLQLNLLRGLDLQAAYDLCPDSNPVERQEWENAVDALVAQVETFYEDPDQPGTYIPNPALTEFVGVGDPVEIRNDNVPRDSYALSATGPGEGYLCLLENSGTAFTDPGEPVAMKIFKVGGPDLYRGELKIIAADNPLSELVTFQHTADLAARSDEFEYEWKIAAPVDGFPPLVDFAMSRYLPLVDGSDLPRYTLGGAGIQALGDNYVVMRYRATDLDHPLVGQWSEWTTPALAEGWIKRVLAGINPFSQRVTDLFNNRVNTDVSILTQAGTRWEGDIALNLDTINDYGLIEIYETVLRRGRLLSIEAGFNYGPANDALLLAAGYLNDLYMMLGNEAWADAANPTIGIGTADNTYGDIATALFSFKGQQASLLEEELALLRGRDDVFQPGVEVRPIYNRLIWNYTRGIDAGEVIYALNYNILENPDLEPDGVIDAEDAAHMYPQGHGDAYGHYLTALKGYYSLLMNDKFDWVPRIEAVNILSTPVSVDYQDERKFAAAAAALARAGRQVFDLTWRQEYQSVDNAGWEHFADTRENTQRSYVSAGGVTNHPVRHWGMDPWASRVGQGTYLNWVVGNSMLPAVDPDPTHEGIQKVDRTTVPELKELPVLARDLQTALDNAEAGFSPLGVPEDAIALDIDSDVIGDGSETHFEQIYRRSIAALNNAVASFDDAKDVTRLMRSEQDSLDGLQNRVVEQELAFRNAMIELYGTPYPDDMGPGKTWKQDYDGPDTIHYRYVETPELPFAGLWNYPGEIVEDTWSISLADLPADWQDNYALTGLDVLNNPLYSDAERVVNFNVGPHGYFEKPGDWTSTRASPGKIQQAVSAEIQAQTLLLRTVYNQTATKASLDRLIGLFKAEIDTYDDIRDRQEALLIAEEVLEKAKFANDLFQKIQDSIKEDIIFLSDASSEALPGSLVVGFSTGGDLTSAGRAAIEIAGYGTVKVLDKVALARAGVIAALETATSSHKRWEEFNEIQVLERERDQRAALVEIGDFFEGMQFQLWDINLKLRDYDAAQRAVRAAIAQGDRIQEEREIFRKRSSALVQGFRTRDAAFRIFRNEKLERYKTLFDLASRYTLLAANAYDYETGLLDTDAGRTFIQRIIQARALGVIGPNGEPQFAGSNTGDPGLSSALAEMKADWDVVRGRLGFNNPDAYGTTASLRTENFRILPGEAGDANWAQILREGRVRDLLEDPDVRRYCMQISNGDGLPVPGIVLNFRTTITDGYNLFGKQLAGGDHAYSPSSFATKLFAVGIALEGYQGMDDPAANAGGGTSPPDPDLSFLDPMALSATPYMYLVPVGADLMRSPPLGDASGIRSWMVKDVAIPMPFNIGASDFSTLGLYQSSDSLTEPLFTVRKHQAFRPVSTASLFSPDIYNETGGLQPSQFTNGRLIGRSVWNNHWKLIIPGKTLLNDPNEGLERLIQTLDDIKLYFVTYSYSGN